MALLQGLDWIFVFLAAECAARWGAGVSLLHAPLRHGAVFLAAAGALKIGLWLTETYRHDARGFGGLALGAILGIVAASVLAPDPRSAAALAAIVPVTALALAGVHAALGVWSDAARRAGVFAENVVLIGATDAARRMIRRAAKSGEIRVLAIAEDRSARAPADLGGVPVAGGVAELIAWRGLADVERIVIAVPHQAEARVRSLIQQLQQVPNRVDLLLDYETQSVSGARSRRFAGAAVACVSGFRRAPSLRGAIKRAQDLILGALLAMLFALPMAAIAMAVKLGSKGPVLYRQQRVGLNNRVFTLLKFRTLRHEPGARPRAVRVNDPRVAALGRLLRRTGLDELPMLWNLLAGDISLIGPRPHAPNMKAAGLACADIIARYAHRHRVKPGLIGWAQVKGAGGPMKTLGAARKQIKLDLEYAANASPWLDLQIMARVATGRMRR